MKNNSVFIIAEAGVNHNGSVETALKLVDAAVEAAADAVKFQTFRAEELVTADARQCSYQEQNAKADSQFEMLRQLELDDAAHQEIAAHCRKVGIEFMSTAFDPESLNYLVNDVGIEHIKIPSGELVNPLLLLAAAQTGKPVIMSTGMANMDEVESALGVLAFGGLNAGQTPKAGEWHETFSSEKGRRWLFEHVTLLHCTTAYPAPLETVNLRAMNALADKFGLKVGFSDHTQGLDVATSAVAMGGCVIEKHFTLDREMEGPDHKASLVPSDLKTMISNIRNIELALGDSGKSSVGVELENSKMVRRVLVAARDIHEGETLDEDAISMKRAGEGISAMEYWSWIGRKANRSYRRHECLNL